MEFIELQITIVSAENVGPVDVDLWRQARVQAEISLNGRRRRRTVVDRVGGRNPQWNMVADFRIKESDVREPGLDAVVKLYHKDFSERDMLVGEAIISVSGLFLQGIAASVSYPVTGMGTGTGTGRLNISYKFGEKGVRRTQRWFEGIHSYSSSPTSCRASSVTRPRRYNSIQDSSEESSSLTPTPYSEDFSPLLTPYTVGSSEESSSLTPYSEEFSSPTPTRSDLPSIQTRANNREVCFYSEDFSPLLTPYTVGSSEESSSLTPYSEEFSSPTPTRSDLPSIQTRANNRELGRLRRVIRISAEIRGLQESKPLDLEQMSMGIMELRNIIYLKDFILFCSVFPLHYEFTKDVLVWQWIAGRLIELEEVEITEKVCMEHFNTLLGMDYIQRSGYDHVLDQAKYKIGDKMITFIQHQPLQPKFGGYLDSIHHDPTKVELLSLSFKKIDQAVLKQYSCLHTLVIHDCYEADHLPSDIFSELKSLKILNLSRTNIVELPSSVENLKELRFLDMSNTPLVWVPESICSHTHLQTLKFDGCLQLEGLPEGTSNLINLRHLILDVVRQLESMPIRIGKLSNLRTLSAFLVSKKGGCSVRELKYLNNLRGTFRLLNLENVRTKKEASEACLCKKVELRKIEFQWSDLQDEKIPKEEEILESLKPVVGIQELKILFYSGGVLPSWICDPSFQELVTIFLYKCRYCISLPSLGELPSLKHLSIIENKEVVKIDSSFCRKQGNQNHAAFPKLEKLTFESMSILELWTGFEMGDFPSLRHLIIEYCPKLVGLHYLWFLESLSHLEIRYCPELLLVPYDTIPPSLQSLMIKESPRMKEWCCEEDWCKIARVPTVYFDHQKFPPEM